MKVNLLRILLVMLTAIAVVVAGCGNNVNNANNADNTGGSKAKEQTTTTIGTSSTGSIYNIIAVGMADIITRNAGVNASAVTTGGADATLRAIADKKTEFGVVHTWSLQKAYDGTEPFKAAVKIRQVLQGQETGVYLVARADAKIESPKDLKGKKLIGKRPALKSIDEFTFALLDLYGIKPNELTIIQTAETGEAVDALKVGSVDAAVIPGGIGSPQLKELAQTINLKFVKIDKMKELTAHSGITKGGFIAVNPAGTYKGQTEEIPFLCYNTVLAVDAGASDDLVYKVAKTLIEKHDLLQKVHPTGKMWTLENTLSNANFTVPFHPGAVKFFKEAGKWNEQMDKRQSELLKK